MGMTKEAWLLRKERYPPNGFKNLDYQREAIETRRRRYGPNGLSKKALKHMKQLGRIQGKKNTGPSNNIKAWRTRRARYGKRGFKISKEEFGRRISHPSNKKGLTWEEFYGEERAKQIKNREADTVKSLWEDVNSVYNTKEYRARHLKAVLKIATENLMKWRDYVTPEELQRLAAKGRSIHPNKLEQRLADLCERFDLPFEFTGAEPYPGFGGKMPDFVSKDGSKKIIEVFGDHWHRKNEEKTRKEFFRQFGFDTLILWESYFKASSDIEIVVRIKLFLGD